MKIFKRIAAVALTIATIVTIITTASAEIITTANYNGSLTMLKTKSMYELGWNEVCSTNELSWNFLNGQKTANPEKTINIQLADSASDTYNIGCVIATLYKNCTSEDAFIWTEKMHITDKYGETVIAELRYDNVTGRYYIVNLGTYESTFKGNGKTFVSSLIDMGILSVRLSKATYNEATNKYYFLNTFENDHIVTSNEIRSSATSYNFGYTAKSPTIDNSGNKYFYANYITFKRRIVGVTVRDKVTQSTYAASFSSARNKTLVSLRNTDRSKVQINANGDIWTCWARTLDTPYRTQDMIHDISIGMYGYNDNLFTITHTADGYYTNNDYDNDGSYLKKDGTLVSSIEQLDKVNKNVTLKNGTKVTEYVAAKNYGMYYFVKHDSDEIKLYVGHGYEIQGAANTEATAMKYIDQIKHSAFSRIRDILALQYSSYTVDVYVQNNTSKRYINDVKYKLTYSYNGI